MHTAARQLISALSTASPLIGTIGIKPQAKKCKFGVADISFHNYSMRRIADRCRHSRNALIGALLCESLELGRNGNGVSITFKEYGPC